MKTFYLLTTFLMLSMISIAQPKITLLTFESFSWGDDITTTDGFDGRIGEGFQYGGGFEFELIENTAVELIYQRLETNGYIFYNAGLLGGFGQTTGKININYYMLGGTRYLPFGTGKVAGFASLDGGLGSFYTTGDASGKTSNFNKFAWGGRLGLRISPNEKFSIRIHGQIISAVQAFGGGLYFGTGGGGAGVSGYSTFWQWNVGGSLNYRLK